MPTKFGRIAAAKVRVTLRASRSESGMNGMNCLKMSRVFLATVDDSLSMLCGPYCKNKLQRSAFCTITIHHLQYPSRISLPWPQSFGCSNYHLQRPWHRAMMCHELWGGTMKM
eukprot:s934_g9.t1